MEDTITPLIAQGQLQQAQAQLVAAIKARAADPSLRMAYFQLLALQRNWEKALLQLATAAQMDDSLLMVAQQGRLCIQCEVHREKVIAGQLTPMVFGEPLPWLSSLLQAHALFTQGRHTPAAELREQALSDAPAIAGRIDGQPFEWIADADLRFGPVLEVFVEGRYSWLPIQHLARLELDAPSELRDVLWMPARFFLTNGGQVPGFLAARYPFLPDHPLNDDPLILLGRKTEWVEQDGLQIGLGQRLLATDTADFALLDVRRIELDQPASPPTPAPSSST